MELSRPLVRGRLVLPGRGFFGVGIVVSGIGVGMLSEFLETLVVMCAILFFSCYHGTGTPRKNLRNFYSYPEGVQKAVLEDARWASQVPAKKSTVASFVANLVAFTIIFVGWGLVIRAPLAAASPGLAVRSSCLLGAGSFGQPGGLLPTFLFFLALGEALNLFDLLVIDLLWWRNSPRVRFEGVDDPALYRDARPHVASFSRGVPMFAVAAFAASLVLCL